MKEVQLSVLKTTESVSAGFSGVIIAYVNIKDHLKGTCFSLFCNMYSSYLIHSLESLNQISRTGLVSETWEI